jgi:hypothetical protein
MVTFIDLYNQGAYFKLTELDTEKPKTVALPTYKGSPYHSSNCNLCKAFLRHLQACIDLYGAC